MPTLFGNEFDGASGVARAVLAYLTAHGDGIEESYDVMTGEHLAVPRYGRWEDGARQGYVVYMRGDGKFRTSQVNVAFLNDSSGGILLWSWPSGVTVNAPTIDRVPEHFRWFPFRFGQAYEAAGVVRSILVDFWKNGDANA